MTDTPNPKKLSPEKVKELIKNWLELCKKCRQAELTMLQLLRHPQATIEQIDEVRKDYAKRCEDMQKRKAQLISLFQTSKLGEPYSNYRTTVMLEQTPFSYTQYKQTN